MPLVSLRDIYRVAGRRNFAVGQFNVYNLEVIQAVLAAAEELRSPIILGLTPAALAYSGLELAAALIKAAAAKTDVPVVLHLDHGTSIEDAVECMEAGFTSVMIDASREPVHENVRITREVVKTAHPRNVAVEAELGRLAGNGREWPDNENGTGLTDPGEAAEFTSKTGCDALAVAVGTRHGAYKYRETPYLDFDRIKAIKGKTGIPLVLHGASGVDKRMVERAEKYGAVLSGAMGVPDEAVRKAIALGVNKVNIDTDLRLAWVASVREYFMAHRDIFDPKKILSAARDEIQKVVQAKITLFGSGNKAT
jgi:fructose-bisphosphate aldolase class II